MKKFFSTGNKSGLFRPGRQEPDHHQPLLITHPTTNANAFGDQISRDGADADFDVVVVMTNEDRDAAMARQLQAELFGDQPCHFAAGQEQLWDEDLKLAMELQSKENATALGGGPFQDEQQCEKARYDPGTVILRGSVSQYSFAPGGESACTSICLLAALELLANGDLGAGRLAPSLCPESLDGIVRRGVEAHRSLGAAHASLDELWSLGAFADAVAYLERRKPFHGAAGPEFRRSLEAALECGKRAGAGCVAVLLTKPPETVLCIASRCGRGVCWFLFDSHGEADRSTKLVHLKRYNSTEDMARGLQVKFPCIPSDMGGTLQAEMYNSFEAHPIIYRLPEQGHVGSFKSSGMSACQGDLDQDENLVRALEESKREASSVQEHSHPTLRQQGECHDEQLTQVLEKSGKEASIYNKCNSPGKQQASSEDEQPLQVIANGPSPYKKREHVSPMDDSKKEGKHSDCAAIPQAYESATAPPPPKVPVNDSFLDPITFEVIADPVVCDDGFTYDRQNIERHFRTRIEAEERRIREEEQKTNGDDDTQSGTEDTVCCAARREIQLTSPKTGEVVTDKLVPNRNIEQQIVELVESERLDMTDEDVKDWHERRERKKADDQLRAENRRKEEDRQEEMRRNREEAMRRRAQEATGAEAAESVKLPPSELVSVDRRVAGGCESLCDGDLGLSVALCDEAARIPIDYASAICAGNVPRCMVACCARHLRGDYQWCSRCGRLACPSCLEFVVTRYGDRRPPSPHKICGECVTQLVDVMDHKGGVGQVRAFIINVRLKTHLDGLTNRAAKHQERRARLDAEEKFGPDIRQLKQDIKRMARERDGLRAQIRDATRRAESARRDDGSLAIDGTLLRSENAGGSLAEWEETCTHLQKQYEDLISKDVPEDEEAQVAHLTAVTDVSNRLEASQIRLTELHSSLNAAAVAPRAAGLTGRDLFGGKSVAEWEDTCSELQKQYDDLVAMELPEEEDAQVAHTESLSLVATRLESAQVNLMQAKTAETPSSDIDNSSGQRLKPQRLKSAPEWEITCANLRQQYDDLLAQDPPQDENAQVAHTEAISLVANRLEEAQISLIEAKSAASAASKTTGTNRTPPSSKDILRLLARFESLASTKGQSNTPIKVSTKERRRLLWGKKKAKQDKNDKPPEAATAAMESHAARLRAAQTRIEKAEKESGSPTNQHILLESLSDMLELLRSIALQVGNMSQEDRTVFAAAKKEVEKKYQSARTVVLGEVANDKPPSAPPKAGEERSSVGNGNKEPPSRKPSSTPARQQSLTELQAEFVSLNAVDLSTLADDDAVTAHMMRLTEIVEIFRSARESSVSDEESAASCFDQFENPCLVDDDDPGLLAVIGLRDEDWPLPLDLSYPTTRMENQLELLRNALEQQLAEVERKYDNIYGRKSQSLNDQRDKLEDEIEQARADAQDAEATAEAEQRRLRDREARRRKEEEERQERERARLEKERRAREEAERLHRKHAADENATRDAFARVARSEGGAEAFGGRGDLRMCKMCKAGPIENIACADLSAHNDSSTSYKGTAVGSRAKPNHCPNCDWFDSDWHKWPMWDGIAGPH